MHRTANQSHALARVPRSAVGESSCRGTSPARHQYRAPARSGPELAQAIPGARPQSELSAGAAVAGTLLESSPDGKSRSVFLEVTREIYAPRRLMDLPAPSGKGC